MHWPYSDLADLPTDVYEELILMIGDAMRESNPDAGEDDTPDFLKP